MDIFVAVSKTRQMVVEGAPLEILQEFPVLLNDLLVLQRQAAEFTGQPDNVFGAGDGAHPVGPVVKLHPPVSDQQIVFRAFKGQLPV